MVQESFLSDNMKKRSISFPIPTIRRSTRFRSVRLLPEPENDDRDTEESLDIPAEKLSFIASFLKMSSLLFVTPFRVIRNLEDDNGPHIILIPRGILGKIFCLFTQCSLLGFLVQAVINALDKIEKKVEAWAVLISITHAFEGLLLLLTFSTLWLHMEDLQTLLKNLEDWRTLSRKKENTPNHEERVYSRFTWGIMKLCKGPDAVLWWAYIGVVIRGLQSSYERQTIWNTSFSIVNTLFPFGQYSKKILVYPACVLVFMLEKSLCVTELNILSGALSMYQVGTQFTAQAKLATTPTELMEAHKMLRRIFNRFNNIFGRLFLSHYVCTLLSYVTLPAMMTKMTFSVDKLIGRLVYMGMHTVTYWSSCEVHSKIKDSIMDWLHLSKLRKEVYPIDLIKLGILSSEVESQPVGISCNVFVLTYGSMGSFLALLATYAIFAWQMQAHGLK